ncbi:MAG: DNA primase DnaG [Haloferacaceae archaeon]
MNDTAKYLIHATIAADGVVERSDVVGAVFGQTEGLLGEQLDLRELQQASKVGRIDVQIESENGQSFGEVTIASSLDKAETAILAASLETITRVGPCHAHIEVTDIEDVRAAKRRAVVERAKELLATGFDESIISSEEILAEVRESIRVEDVVDYEGLPAGPRVHDSDAVILVEGRADVVRLLQYGIKNAVAVEGTNVPDAIANLTEERTVTAFLDGDRGGELILQELAQVGDVDYVTFAPAGRSVEELDREAVMDALRAKVSYGQVSEEPNVRLSLQGDGADPLSGSRVPTDPAAPDADDGDRDADEDIGDGEDAGTDTGGEEPTADADGATEAANADGATEAANADGTLETDDAVDAALDELGLGSRKELETGSDAVEELDDEPVPESVPEAEADEEVESETPGDDSETPGDDSETPGDDSETDDQPLTLRHHVETVIGGSTGLARLLDDDFEVIEEVDADGAFEAVESADGSPHALVIDGEAAQRLLDVVAQRDVDQLVATSTGDYVKQPVGTRVLTADQLLVEA